MSARSRRVGGPGLGEDASRNVEMSLMGGQPMTVIESKVR